MPYSKMVSPLLILLACLAFVVFFIFRKKYLKDHLPEIIVCISALVFVFWYNTMPQKLSHVPEYMALGFIVHSALKTDFQGPGVFPLAFAITALLGVVDEMMQGINPGRYFGYPDMVVNALSGLAGLCCIRIFQAPRMDPAPAGFSSPKIILMGALFMAFIGAVAAADIFFLFKEVANKTRFSDFPASLRHLNILCLAAVPAFPGLIYYWRNSLTRNAAVTLLSMSMALEIIISIVVYCDFFSKEFV